MEDTLDGLDDESDGLNSSDNERNGSEALDDRLSADGFILGSWLDWERLRGAGVTNEAADVAAVLDITPVSNAR
ncbi:hypothetical protein NM688_g8558 [Phlebia brevispora]|uniref:Uncharacterized protein n=1 Tax=Phlebia brevispora TaxID=194682 RepID=A0ACC1RSV5_9APHY|nr:hypothetical protein NM688_g8558 [Phlebia brevispora]